MKYIIKIYEDVTSLDGSLFIYSLSFSLLLALAPAIMLFVMMFQWFLLDADIIVTAASHYMPIELVEPFVTYIVGNGTGNLVTSVVSVVIALWLASRSIYSFMMISAKTECVDYPKWGLRLKSMLIFLFVCLYVVLCLFLVTQLLVFARLLVLAIYLAAAPVGFYLFYRRLTYEKRDIYYGMPGAVFASVSIFLIGFLFFTIINVFTNYSSVYGPLASLVILFLSIYLIAGVIYVGYRLNDIFDYDSVGELKRDPFLELCVSLQNSFVSKFQLKRRTKHENRDH